MTEQKVEILTIYGKAGSGKTTKLLELIGKTKNYVVLAPTNAAVENIWNMAVSQLPKTPNRDNFKTMYSFFRIDYENDNVLGAVYCPKNIFIDEFGLMNKYLFKRCILNAEMNGCEKIIICGDVMQLNPIYPTKQLISLSKLNRLNQNYDKIMKQINHNNETNLLFPSVVEHIQLNLFGTKRIRNSKLMMLDSNKRANNEVKEILNNIYSGNKSFHYQFVEFYDLPKLINDEKYIFIAAKYKILQQVYDLIYENYLKQYEPIIINQSTSFKTSYKRLYLIPGMNIIACDTVKNEYINGQELIFSGNIESQGLKCINPLNNETIYIHECKDRFNNNYFPITPSYLLSVHKSQGRSIEKVIVCIDDMFEISMLYTAITRSKSVLRFYSKEQVSNRIDKLIENAFIPEFKQLNTMARFMYSVH